MSTMNITESERAQIVEILERRANDIADYRDKHDRDANNPHGGVLPGSVELALTREIERLRMLANKIQPSRREEGGGA